MLDEAFPRDDRSGRSRGCEQRVDEWLSVSDSVHTQRTHRPQVRWSPNRVQISSFEDRLAEMSGLVESTFFEEDIESWIGNLDSGFIERYLAVQSQRPLHFPPPRCF